MRKIWGLQIQKNFLKITKKRPLLGGFLIDFFGKKSKKKWKIWKIQEKSGKIWGIQIKKNFLKITQKRPLLGGFLIDFFWKKIKKKVKNLKISGKNGKNMGTPNPKEFFEKKTKIDPFLNTFPKKKFLKKKVDFSGSVWKQKSCLLI